MNEGIFAIAATFGSAIAIVFLVLTYQLLKLRVAGRNRPPEHEKVADGDAGHLAARAVRMEQRIGNLEEILRGSVQDERRG
jgi:hypothetical protein